MEHRWDYIYEPDARQLIEGLVTRYRGVAGVPSGH